MSGFEPNESMSLSRLQRRVSTLVFALPEAADFALAGGGALIAHQVVDRTTRDLDCFGPSLDAVDRLWPAIHAALIADGLEVDVRQASHGFAKITVIDPTTRETTQVDVGFDPAGRPTISTASVQCVRWKILPATSSWRCSVGLLHVTLSTCSRCVFGSTAEISKASKWPRAAASNLAC